MPPVTRGARSGSIQSIEVCLETHTALGLAGNEWELAENEYFSQGEMGGCFNYMLQ